MNIPTYLYSTLAFSFFFYAFGLSYVTCIIISLTINSLFYAVTQ